MRDKIIINHKIDNKIEIKIEIKIDNMIINNISQRNNMNKNKDSRMMKIIINKDRMTENNKDLMEMMIDKLDIMIGRTDLRMIDIKIDNTSNKEITE